MRLRSIALLLPLLVSALWSAPAAAEHVITLADNTKITGTLVHFYDGVAHIRVASGATLQLPEAKIRRIEFDLPKPRAELSTPEKTFERMRKAALRGDLDTYIDSHSSYYQIYLNHQVMGVGAQKFGVSMKKEWGSLQIEVLKTTVNGDTALMNVRRVVGEQSHEGELRFVRENKEWKIILPI